MNSERFIQFMCAAIAGGQEPAMAAITAEQAIEEYKDFLRRRQITDAGVNMGALQDAGQFDHSTAPQAGDKAPLHDAHVQAYEEFKRGLG